MARKGEFECPPYFSVGETNGLPQKRKDYRRRKRAIVNRPYVLLLQIMERKWEDNLFPCDKKCGNFTV